MAGYSQVLYNGATLHVFDTKGLNKCELRLSSSSKVAKLSSLRYTDIDTTKYKERARLNAAVFEMETSTHVGWEYSDVFKISCGQDERADLLEMNDGSWVIGHVDKADVNLDEIKWAYSGSHVILKDGNDVCIVPSWREKYTTGKYCWSFTAKRADGTYVLGAVDQSCTISTDDLREYLKGLGCTDAMINDGGGSAELIVDGKITNRTSERAIANGLFLFESTIPVEEEKPSENENNEATENVIELENKIVELEQVIATLKVTVVELQTALDESTKELEKANTIIESIKQLVN